MLSKQHGYIITFLVDQSWWLSYGLCFFINIYDFIATESWMTNNATFNKYCVEYIINKTYMSLSKSKVNMYSFKNWDLRILRKN